MPTSTSCTNCKQNPFSEIENKCIFSVRLPGCSRIHLIFDGESECLHQVCHGKAQHAESHMEDISRRIDQIFKKRQSRYKTVPPMPHFSVHLHVTYNKYFLCTCSASTQCLWAALSLEKMSIDFQIYFAQESRNKRCLPLWNFQTQECDFCCTFCLKNLSKEHKRSYANPPHFSAHRKVYCSFILLP